MLTVGKLARRFGLSRSTLLYYDSIGLLTPSLHQPGEYRFYSEDDTSRLEQICMYRKAGIPLKNIVRILDGPESELGIILRQRFEELGREIALLGEQQEVIAGLLQNPELAMQARGMSRKLWVSLLRSSGFSDDDMKKWHIRFERMAPLKHETFLKHLGISTKEREEIRSWAEAE
ncbi:MAG: MerR family transcriptional regulator [Desulfocapsaceae bacterium]|nr:MerR family transcriptional regulator [Desulfocapsaceae bacterium]